MRRLLLLPLLALFGCDYDALIFRCADARVCIDYEIGAPRLTFPRSGASSGKLTGTTVAIPVGFTHPSAEERPFEAQVGYCKTVSDACFAGAGVIPLQGRVMTLTPPTDFRGVKAVWRVRACGGEFGACGPWSQARYLRLNAPGAIVAGDLDAATVGSAGQRSAELLVGNPDALSVMVLSDSGSILEDSYLAPEAPSFGTLVSQVGDVDGDGVDDVVMGGGDASSRTLFLVKGRGGQGLDFGARVQLASQGAGFGAAVTSAGDFNGDGLGDFLVTHPGTGTWLYLGGAEAPPVRLTLSTGPGPAASAAGIGDLNADGFDDLVLSAGAIGEVYLYYGRASPGATLTPSDVLEPIDPNPTFGARVAGIGDFNADGHPEFVVADDDGDLVLFFGSEALSPGTLPGYDEISDSTAIQDIVAGDFDGDGIGDYALRFDTQILTYFGDPTLGPTDGYQDYDYLAAPTDTTTDFIDEYPRSLASAGDLNGDGIDELMVGYDRESGAAGLHRVTYAGGRSEPVTSFFPSEYGNAFGLPIASVRP